MDDRPLHRTLMAAAASAVPVHLSERIDEVQDHLRAGDLALLLDFDGTLAPIVRRPEEARALPAARRSIERLAAAGCRVAVISGRALTDVRDRLDLEGIDYAGNHGLEIEGPQLQRRHETAQAALAALDSVRERLPRRLREVPGAWIEDKGMTLSVHYRETPPAHWPEVERAVRAVAASDDLAVRGGKRIWEVRPRVDWDKGRAVEFLLRAWDEPDAWPLYIGDDETDEDAFRAVADRGLGVRVSDGAPEATAAGAYLRSPEEVGEFLAELGESVRR